MLSRSFFIKRCHLTVVALSPLHSANISIDEINKFKAESTKWWDDAKLLLKMNAVRVPYIRNNIKRSLYADTLNGVSVIDVGCGGGFLSEALARSGAKVIGIDPGADMIAVAKSHQLLDPLIANNLQYRHCSVDDVANEGKQYDAVVASEVVEHVADLGDFLSKVSAIIKPGGSLFLTTINRTAMSYWLAIVMVEYVFGLVNQGTHNWEQFITPSELTAILEKHGMLSKSLQGISFDPLCGHWSLTSSTDINYMMHFIKSVSQ